MPKYVDPEVSRIKFAAEIDQFKSLRDIYIKRGIWLLKDDYPFALFAFAKALIPAAVIFGAMIDFTDYDLHPLSVKLVNPFTQIPLKGTEVLTHFMRLVPASGANPAAPPTSLLAIHSNNEPFICLPGLREYHDHPAHTGDSWLLHRGKGEGTLNFVVDKLHHYGVEGVSGYNMAMNIMITNFQQHPVE
jgi:hypothetical protein